MKKSILMLWTLVSLCFIGCHKTETPPPSSDAVAQNADDHANSKAETPQPDLKALENTNLPHKKVQDPQNHYAQRPHVEIPFPHLNDVAIPPVRSEANDAQTRVMYLYENDSFIEKYQQQLLTQGFEKKQDNIYIKLLDSQPLIVKITGGEGEYWIDMMTTRDPEDRYQRIPDKNIPYPLDNHIFAAEFADIQLPNEASNETVYIYYNRTPSFITDYEQLLKNAGFENVRTPDSPFYTKQNDKNIEYSVGIEKLNEAGTDIRIKMMSIQLEASP